MAMNIHQYCFVNATTYNGGSFARDIIETTW